MRYRGKITTWKENRGFGFITPDGGDRQVFVHLKAFLNQQHRPVGNEIVTYKLATDDAGRTRAENVLFAGDRLSLRVSILKRPLSLILSSLFLLVVAYTVLTGRLPVVVLGLYLSASSVAFLIYALDKSAAANNSWRVPESTLHFLAVMGGWPGALAAQTLLRHKSKKQSFQFVFWWTVIINVGAFVWLHTQRGASSLISVLKAMSLSGLLH